MFHNRRLVARQIKCTREKFVLDSVLQIKSNTFECLNNLQNDISSPLCLPSKCLTMHCKYKQSLFLLMKRCCGTLLSLSRQSLTEAVSIHRRRIQDSVKRCVMPLFHKTSHFRHKWLKWLMRFFFLISEIYIFSLCSTRCAPNAEKLLKHPTTRLKLHYIYDFYTLFFFFKDLVSTL